MDMVIKSLRQKALKLFQVGIDAADPHQAVKNCLAMVNDEFEIALSLNDQTEKRSGDWPKIHLIAFGKAACSMAEAAVDIIPEYRLAGQPIVVTNYENVRVVKNCKVIGAGHPLPDSAGQQAALSIVKRLKTTKENELVLVLVSGGGSALIPYPAGGLTLKDKIATTDLLLASGANINQINCVRKHLSQLKGGQLARLAAPADLHALILSDVLSDDLSVIASGPTVPDNTTFLDAVNILKEKNIWADIPESVRSFLQKGEQGLCAETPAANDVCFKKTSQTLVGSNSISLNALADAVNKSGFEIDIFSHNLSGEARDAAERIVLYAKNRIKNGLTSSTAILAGGETTVTLKGSGRGGRNQEMALAFSIASRKHNLNGNWVFLSGGTDGRDGPTDAAGGIVDPASYTRMINAGINPENSMNNNDSYSALEKTEDLVITKATGTNVADLQVLLIQQE